MSALTLLKEIFMLVLTNTRKVGNSTTKVDSLVKTLKGVV